MYGSCGDVDLLSEVLRTAPTPMQRMMDHPLVRQWPLGVATYRGFPTSIALASALGSTLHGAYSVPDAVAPVEGRRRFLCNLQATV